MPTYRIVVTAVAEGADPHTVRREAARLFGLEEGSERLEALFSGFPVTVKRGLDEARARAYLERLRQIGLACERVEEEVAPPPPAPGGEPAGLPGTAREVTGEAAPEPPSGGDEWTGNPYRQPEAELEVTPLSAGAHRLLDLPRRLPASEGMAWIREGWGYFTSAPLVWIGMLLMGVALFVGGAFLVGVMGALMPPLILLFGIALYLLTPVFSASFIVACHELEQGQPIGVGHLFAGFRSNLGGLMLLGLIYALANFALSLLLMGGMMGMTGSDMAHMLDGGDPAMSGLLFNLLYLLVTIPLFMAYWFAPALVAIDGISPTRAMVMSFKGCLVNLGPFLIYGLVGLVLAIVATLPFGLGWLVLAPVLSGSIYAGYRGIFVEPDEERPA